MSHEQNDPLLRIRACAIGLSQALERMDVSERRTYPSREFGRNYNNLISKTRELDPDLATLLPPMVPIEEDQSGIMTTEIWSYCTQLAELIARRASESPQ